MKPLKQYAYLFTSGEFKIWDNKTKTPMTFDSGQLCYMEMMKDNTDRTFDNYTLIARPISDMTDEELTEFTYSSNTTPEGVKGYLTGKANNNLLKLHEGEKLLSKGVYPFPQSHFDDGTVININDI